MKYFSYKGQMLNMSQLSELTGIKYTTLAERLKRGYTVEEAVAESKKIPESVSEFVDSSFPPDWDGMSNTVLYSIYRGWCSKNGYSPETNIHFMRSLKSLLSYLRVVPTRVNEYGTVKCKRLIRIDAGSAPEFMREDRDAI